MGKLTVYYPHIYALFYPVQSLSFFVLVSTFLCYEKMLKIIIIT